MDPICCRVLQSTSPTASVMVYLFQNPKGAYLSVRVAFTTRISDHKMDLISREATNKAVPTIQRWTYCASTRGY